MFEMTFLGLGGGGRGRGTGRGGGAGTEQGFLPVPTVIPTAAAAAVETAPFSSLGASNGTDTAAKHDAADAAVTLALPSKSPPGPVDV